MQRQTIETFLNEHKDTPLVDVRSPAEFADGHIPGAVNLPVFSNKERALVGTTYKQVGKIEAIEEGLEIVGPKMKDLAAKAKQLAKDGELKVYCWRGGMRSEKMAWLFEIVGLQVKVLEGGYKSYRASIAEHFAQLSNLIVLQGPTGTGKTKILEALGVQGEQVIDLEGMAHHKGSAFGGLGMPDQPTTQQFQNDLSALLDTFDLTRRVWVESESMSIGKVYLPEHLWQQMNLSRRVALDQPREWRLDRVVEEYGDFESELLISKVEQLEQRLGNQNVNQVNEYLQSGDIRAAADILLFYYDKSYAYSAKKYKHSASVEVILDTPEAAPCAAKLIEFADDQQWL